MGNMLANDIRTQYDRTFATLRGIVEDFPDDKWLVIHGEDDFYIPSRIAYHLASYLDRHMTEGFKDKEFDLKCPFGEWRKGDATTLPDKKAFLAYYDEVLARAREKLASLDDESLSAPMEPERTYWGACQLGVHLAMMREYSAHCGELNKIRIEYGLPDVWVSR
ncbi:MAG: DinB family protein [Peptococcaceae bacterium]|jgi:hypothetical protein|nr:DinB family protein [Peptococcaceae bacterium]